jgi:hypothetical protein
LNMAECSGSLPTASNTKRGRIRLNRPELLEKNAWQ